MSFKEKAARYHQAVSEYDTAVIRRMLRENYIQHNPMVPTGRQAFLDLIPSLKSYGARIENQRMFEDGPYVVMHHRWYNATPMGAPDLVAFHIIRFDAQGFIAEHWNVATPLTDTKSLMQISGSKAIIENKSNLAFKSKVGKLVDYWIAGGVSISGLQDYFYEDFVQHHPDIQSGIKSLHQYQRSHMKYLKKHKVLGEGSFVLSIAEGTLDRVPTAFYDLFCFEEDRIIEHWSVYQPIAQGQTANINTMFDFPKDEYPVI